MEDIKHAALQDRPIDREEAGQLDRGPFVESLVRALVREERSPSGELISRRSTGFVIGLTGPWGLGKSSILNLLALKLGSMGQVIVASFNPWLFSGRDELLRGFFSELRDATGRSNIEHTKELIAAVDRYWAAIDLTAHATAAFVDLNLTAGGATTLWSGAKSKFKALLNKPKDLSPQQERRALEQKLRKLNAAVVVLIDELDRVEDDEVRAVAQLVKAVGDIKGVSYLVAYDPDRVAMALGRNDRKQGEAYLEKIIQHPIPLRPLFVDDVEALLTAALSNHGVNLAEPGETHEKELLEHLRWTISTPREVKRLIGAFSILELAVRGEINPYDVLAYSWILTKSPSVRNAIASNLDKLVDDPSEIEMLARVAERMGREKATPSPAQILGIDAEMHDRILKLLFPRFDSSRDSAGGDRISRRRNLVRLLYLGNPPGMVPRGEIERLWAIVDIDTLKIELQRLHHEGALFSIIDRLGDFLPQLAPSGDATFWIALSRILPRETDWMEGPENTRQLADDAGSVLLRLARRSPADAQRLKQTVDALIADGDLVLVPWILRKHMFAHGLTKHGGPQFHELAYSKEETLELLERELPRYRSAVLDGKALRRLPNVEAVYVIGNRNKWDETLRMALTNQLKGRSALGTIAALLVPPGYSSDLSSLAELFDPEVVSSEIEKEIGGDWPHDPYIAASVRQLRRILAGRDPHFDDDDDIGNAIITNRDNSGDTLPN